MPTKYLSQDLKDYVVFKPGSFWIYQDSANPLETDSINLVNHIDHIQPQDAGYAPPYEYFNEVLSSSRRGSLTADGEFRNDNICYYAIDSEATYYLSEFTFFTGTHPGQKIEPDGILYYADSLGSMTVNGTSYKNVKAFKFDPATSTLYPKAKVFEIYWAKNVGVIKSKTSTGRVWELKKHNVKQ